MLSTREFPQISRSLPRHSWMRSFHRSCFVLRGGLCAAALGCIAVSGSIFAVHAAAHKRSADVGADVDWATYEGTQGANHYSTLSQVNQSNVSKLQVAWTYDIGSSLSVGNPLVVKGVMY